MVACTSLHQASHGQQRWSLTLTLPAHSIGCISPFRLSMVGYLQQETTTGHSLYAAQWCRGNRGLSGATELQVASEQPTCHAQCDDTCTQQPSRK